MARHALAQTSNPFELGVASGSPTAKGVVLWTRLLGRYLRPLPEAVPVRWELAEDEAFTRVVAHGEEVAVPSDAHSVHAEPAGLASDRWYWYRFTALGQRSAVGRTRTAPEPGAAASSLSLAVASCQRWEHGHFAAWGEVARQPPDVVLFLGDYIYEYASAPTALRVAGLLPVYSLDDYRQRYAVYKGDPLLQAAHGAAPWIVIWDDHEVENDYANLQGEKLVSEDDFYQRRAAGYKAWWEHMPVPKALRPAGGSASIHGHLDWGGLARMIWLDGRQFRSVQACPRPGRGGSNVVRLRDCPSLAGVERSLLGPQQEGWLAQTWSEQYGWNVLAQQTLMARRSSEPVVDAAIDGRYWTDGWDGYPVSRSRLLQHLAGLRVRNPVVLGGDVHANYVADLKVNFEDERAAVVASEFCGTSISSNGSPQSQLDAMRPFNPHFHHARSDQRGYMRLALTPGRLEVDLRVVHNPRSPNSELSSQGRFVVQAGRAHIERG